VSGTPGSVEEFFAGQPLGPLVHERVRATLQDWPDVTVRVSRSQVAFRRRRGFAYLWRPDQYLRGTHAPVVLSIALDEQLTSPRFKEVVHPGRWMHHLEIFEVGEVDGEVADWVRRAAAEAGPRP
jgi:hypothetical protein